MILLYLYDRVLVFVRVLTYQLFLIVAASVTDLVLKKYIAFTYKKIRNIKNVQGVTAKSVVEFSVLSSSTSY